MTTMEMSDNKCFVCQQISSHEEICSTTSFGNPDLDTRPSEMVRSTMSTWIQRCPHCGYCNDDISMGEKSTKQIVYQKEYQALLNNNTLSSLANSFICFAKIQMNLKKFYDAGFSYLNSAWICDDENKIDESRALRIKAIEQLSKKEAGNDGEHEALLADIMRRALDFENALKMCTQGLPKTKDMVLKNIFQYQMHLISCKDGSCHTFDEMETYVK